MYLNFFVPWLEKTFVHAKSLDNVQLLMTLTTIIYSTVFFVRVQQKNVFLFPTLWSMQCFQRRALVDSGNVMGGDGGKTTGKKTVFKKKVLDGVIHVPVRKRSTRKATPGGKHFLHWGNEWCFKYVSLKVKRNAEVWNPVHILQMETIFESLSDFLRSGIFEYNGSRTNYILLLPVPSRMEKMKIEKDWT